ncbi:MAG: hypothetical protein OEV72_14705, partial [Thermoleophilia bacterium]|nr:hypothetical protein [Thermoleophilia bacterium]
AAVALLLGEDDVPDPLALLLDGVQDDTGAGEPVGEESREVAPRLVASGLGREAGMGDQFAA